MNKKRPQPKLEAFLFLGHSRQFIAFRTEN